MTGFTRRQLMQGGALVALNAALPDVADAAPRIVLNDASQLSPTPVFRHWVTRSNDEQEKVIAALRQELKEAAAAGRPVAVSSARHSMGGQSLPRDGTAITLESRHLTPDRTNMTYLVSGGARWWYVIAVLDKLGFSPAVMQSNNDFGIAATFSVNAHGWPVPYGPFGSTVRSLRLMLADGTIVNCSRTENDELFRLAMGGYGMVGIILDLEVDMVPNVALQPTFETMPAKSFGARFIEAIRAAPAPLMAYGRLNVSRSDFFDEALLVTYRPNGTPTRNLPPAGAGGMFSSLSREVYRAQTGWESIKRTRWFFETVVQPMSGSGIATRNTLMNEPVSNLRSRDTSRTDILHEYFVPPAQFPAFIDACRKVIPNSSLEFLNVTLRYVGPDKDSVLAFAPEERIAAVMSFSQPFTPEGEVEMIRVTEALIDRVVALGGAFYLPYRLHARRDQVAAAYPNVARFIERKRHYDPRLLFRNAMWQGYFANECAPQSCG
jgi:FAD/FMN-containing dehydrogenase